MRRSILFLTLVLAGCTSPVAPSATRDMVQRIVDVDSTIVIAPRSDTVVVVCASLRRCTIR